ILGITCKPQFVPPAQFRTLQAQHRLPVTHLTIRAWAATHPDPDSILRAWYMSQIQPQSGCCNEAYESLVEEARYLTDQAARIRLYRQADAILIREAIAIPFRYVGIHLLIKPWARHYHMSPLAAPFFERVTIEPH
ncbi:MAG: dipeptide transport system substrate-binding protein, partial [Chloroflexota bacterium]|nr:dipeptide transport system substrate-binding protein [Chloroflexota bacterium]